MSSIMLHNTPQQGHHGNGNVKSLKFPLMTKGDFEKIERMLPTTICETLQALGHHWNSITHVKVMGNFLYIFSRSPEAVKHMMGRSQMIQKSLALSPESGVVPPESLITAVGFSDLNVATWPDTRMRMCISIWREQHEEGPIPHEQTEIWRKLEHHAIPAECLTRWNNENGIFFHRAQWRNGELMLASYDGAKIDELCTTRLVLNGEIGEADHWSLEFVYAVCYYCSSPDHMLRDCTLHRNPDVGPTCKRCSKSHLPRDCTEAQLLCPNCDPDHHGDRAHAADDWSKCKAPATLRMMRRCDQKRENMRRERGTRAHGAATGPITPSRATRTNRPTTYAPAEVSTRTHTPTLAALKAMSQTRMLYDSSALQSGDRSTSPPKTVILSSRESSPSPCSPASLRTNTVLDTLPPHSSSPKHGPSSILSPKSGLPAKVAVMDLTAVSDDNYFDFSSDFSDSELGTEDFQLMEDIPTAIGDGQLESPAAAPHLRCLSKSPERNTAVKSTGSSPEVTCAERHTSPPLPTTSACGKTEDPRRARILNTIRDTRDFMPRSVAGEPNQFNKKRRLLDEDEVTANDKCPSFSNSQASSSTSSWQPSTPQGSQNAAQSPSPIQQATPSNSQSSASSGSAEAAVKKRGRPKGSRNKQPTDTKKPRAPWQKSRSDRYMEELLGGPTIDVEKLLNSMALDEVKLFAQLAEIRGMLPTTKRR